MGFSYANSKLRPKGCNMLSGIDHPQVVDVYLALERSLGHVGAISQSSLPTLHLHTSLFGVIPKQSKPGKWRLIIDLSSPEGWSVNDGIERELCSITCFH